MTPGEGQQIFNEIVGLLLTCYIYGLGIGLGVKVFMQGLKW